MTAPQKLMEELYDSVQRRKRPEDVADLIVRCLQGSVPPLHMALKTYTTLQMAAKGALHRRAWQYSSMLDDFHRPVGAQRSVKVAQALFSTAPSLSETACGNPGLVLEFIQMVSGEIGKTYGKSAFRSDRLNREERRQAGLGSISKRGYNKRFRLLVRMEKKVARLAREVMKYEATRIGKSGLATRISEEDFRQDTLTACFVAYFVARRNRRSWFTWGAQSRAYDEVCEALFQELQRSPTTNWWVVAHTYPTQEVLQKLTDDQRGRLLGRWFKVLQQTATLLQETWSSMSVDRTTMIVRRGNDSTTWNNTVSAWNKARDAWIEVVHAMGAVDILDTMTLPKCMRLMAADVAFMHKTFGSGGVHPDTTVCANLPFPWEVLSGQKTCTRQMVEEVCEAHGVNPQKGGWLHPRDKKVAAFEPTPELVHGIIVSNPDLALTLRKAKAFSGKQIKWEGLDNIGEIRKVTDIDKMFVTSV